MIAFAANALASLVYDDMHVGTGAAVWLSKERPLHILWDATLSVVWPDQPDRSTRQHAMLLAVYQRFEPRIVRGLAAQLGISKLAGRWIAWDNPI